MLVHPLRIAMLLPFYGKLPWYFPFFVRSCTENADVDFFLITDINVTIPLPPNIIYVRKTLEDIRKTAFKKLCFQVSLDSPYKLCDFRPAFGMIFTELIKGYDFWGYGDIDVIYGKIRSIVTDDILNNYDVICGKEEYVTGSFSLFRNTEKICSLFKESKDYKKVFRSGVHYCFDECNHHHMDLISGLSIFSLDTEVDCITKIVKEHALRGNLRAHFGLKLIEGIPGELKWDNGYMTYGDKGNILLFHLIDFKKKPYLNIPSWKIIPDRFFINHASISAYHPRSIAGLAAGAMNSLRVVWLHAVKLIKEYSKWLRRRFAIILRSKENTGLTQFTGVYRYNRENVSISLHKNRLRLQRDSEKQFYLLHEQDNRFLISCFMMDGLMNSSVEFCPYGAGSDYTLHVLSGNAPAIVLFRKDDNRGII